MKSGYKPTEVGVIPSDWKVADYVSFGQVIDGDRGFQYPGADDFHASGHCLFLNAGNVTKSGFRLVDTQFISKEKDRKLNNGKLIRGDVVLTTRGTVGNLAFYDDSVAFNDVRINSGMVILRNLSPDVSNRFQYFALRSRTVESQIERLSFGSAQSQLTVRGIASLKIPLPPAKAEQEAIAEALSDADALIESLEQLLAKKRHIKQGAMQELLTGKRRLPGFSGQWEQKPLSDGIQLSSGLHVLAHHCNTDGDGVPYITGPSDFPNGVIQHSKFTTRPGTMCRANDILVTVKGSGAGMLVLADGEYCISRQLMAIRVHDWSMRYIYYSLVRDSSLLGAASAGLIPGLSRGDILNKRIYVPPTQVEQDAIAAFLADMDAEINAIEAKFCKARAIKQGMMQELLTGRIRLV